MVRLTLDNWLMSESEREEDGEANRDTAHVNEPLIGCLRELVSSFISLRRSIYRLTRDDAQERSNETDLESRISCNKLHCLHDRN